MSQVDAIRVCDKGDHRKVFLHHDHLNDVITAPQIAGRLSELIFTHPVKADNSSQLHLDLAKVERISSVGLNHLIGINSRARNLGVTLVLLNVREAVRDIFAVTRLERTFEFESH